MWNKNSKGLLFSLLLVLILSVIAVPALPSTLFADSPESPQVAPINPAFEEYLRQQQNAVRAQQTALQEGIAYTQERNYGCVPPTVDLSYIESLRKQSNLNMQAAADAPTAPLSSFKWTTPTNRVTPIKNQNPCGTCWTFANTAVMESKVWINGLATSPDYSEQALNCCTDHSLAYTADHCNAGGNDFMAQDTFIKKGARQEACQPYDPYIINGQACLACTPAYLTTNFVWVAWDDTTTAARDAIKTAIQTQGPVTVSYYHNDAYMYSGYKYYYTGTNNTTHVVSIVGWDDSVTHPAGGGSGAWLAKNSWGPSWGNSGYFWLCYGKARAQYFGSLRGVKAYSSTEKLYYLDEAGWTRGGYGWTDCTGWGANIFTASPAGNLTHVDFYTGGASTTYEIRVYKSGTITALGTAAATQTGTCNAPGYYSIPLSTPVALNNGQAFTVAVKMTTPGWVYSIPIECFISGYANPTIQTGRSWARHTESNSWFDLASQGTGYNACIRARVTSGGTTADDDEVGVWRGSARYFYIDKNGNGAYNGTATERLGTFLSSYVSGDAPVAGDWDNDGIGEIGVWRKSTRYFYIDKNGNGVYNGTATERLGPFLSTSDPSDRPVAGDWDNDGIDEIGIWRGATRYFFLDKNGNGVYNGTATERLGPFLSSYVSGDAPVAGDWDRDGIDEVGVWRKSTRYFYLDKDGNGIYAGTSERLGPFLSTNDSTDAPVAGNWDGL